MGFPRADGCGVVTVAVSGPNAWQKFSNCRATGGMSPTTKLARMMSMKKPQPGDNSLRNPSKKPAGRYTSPEDKWSAVVARDTGADGCFVFAVRTTGIFCRPSCSSRAPLRKNVDFFDAYELARRAGYRACLRCKPESLDPRLAASARIVKACQLLEGAETSLSSEELARQLGLSRYYFQRLFKRQMGVTPQSYRRRILAERAKKELAGAESVTAALHEAGYSSSSRFYDGAARELGMSPRDALSGADGRMVHYATRECSLGQLLIAWTERGVCEVSFGETVSDVKAALLARFPKAAVAQRSAPSWVASILALVERPCSSNVPLDIQGTAFQQRVWNELGRIPVGETRSYSEVARAIGAPAAVRAVARACAENHLAVVIPCHRVVRSDGGLAGYRWGLARKKELLRREQ